MHRHVLSPCRTGSPAWSPWTRRPSPSARCCRRRASGARWRSRPCPAWTGGDDESVASFMVRRFGEEAFQLLVEPLVGGIHAGDAAHAQPRGHPPHLRTAGEEQRQHHGAAAAAGGGTGRRAAAVSHVSRRDGGAGRGAGGTARPGSRSSAAPPRSRCGGRARLPRRALRRRAGAKRTR